MSQPTPQTDPANDGWSDAVLLARAGRREEDPTGARAAQATFYARHVRYLYGALLRQPKSLLRLAGAGAEDLVQETFHRAFEKGHTFQAGDGTDPDRERARTRAWLGRIATNLLADHAGRFPEIAASPLLDHLESPDEEEPPPSDSPAVKLVAEGLDALTERERDVLRVSALHYRAGRHQRLPNAVSAELASEWQTTSENIRAIRMRAMKKLRSFLVSRGLVEEAS